jgi:hypothetical protein
LQARIGELKQQLEKISGSEGDSAATGVVENSMYPSIRKLPILGVTYGNLYRRTMIQEAVFDTLTQQYELAKVQEAKETPSVKVLDAASIPERKSFPPRLLIALLCALFGLTGAVIWVLGRARWQEAGDDSGKVLATEVFHTVNARMPWATPNGSHVQAMMHRVWLQVVRRSDSEKSTEEPSVRL